MTSTQTRIAASGTATYLLIPKICMDAATPANSATTLARSTKKPVIITKNVERNPNSARMGVVTGKGLSDLIREEFGFRSTFFVMITGFFVDLANVVAEFAGVAASMQIFGVNKYVAVPIAAIVVWVLCLRVTYRQVEVL